MGLPSWKPGLSGLICLPEDDSEPSQNPPRPYYICYVDEKDRCDVIKGSVKWEDAHYPMKDIADRKNIIAFTTPIERKLRMWRSQGYLLLSSVAASNSSTSKSEERSEHYGFIKTDVLNKTAELPTKVSQKEIDRGKSIPEKFAALFDHWADEAVLVAKFPAEKPNLKNRLSEVVKKNVAHACELGICYPDPTQPASFRVADSKRGGPYQWFSYYPSNQTIYTNHEYFVQVAAFRDLVVEYGYSPDWLTFEYNETVPPVSLAIDIGIRFPDGRKAFVEVKETKDQWEALIAVIKSIGERGVDRSAPDRGNDPLRKAKYIVAGKPDFFAGYFGDGFDTYKVVYDSEDRFTLEPASLPNS